MDFKQLKYFIACADAGSFSRAAEILYTTQPNVSKNIKALEEELQVSLFEREKSGIRLTAQGKKIYTYACRVMDEIDFMKGFSEKKEDRWLRVSCNPSSSFADLFVQFYHVHCGSDLHYSLYSASVSGVLQRVRDYKDDLGFIYMMESRQTSLDYVLMRYHLEFVPIKKIRAVLYLGEKCECRAEEGMMADMVNRLRLAQCYQDEFSLDNYWSIRDADGKQVNDLDTVVVTNSDYILERLLKSSELSNISSDYLLPHYEAVGRALPLDFRENQVIFGYVFRRGETLGEWEARFIEFVREQIG